MLRFILGVTFVAVMMLATVGIIWWGTGPGDEPPRQMHAAPCRVVPEDLHP